MKKKSNMYQLAKTRWNPFAGCQFDCGYCAKSFKLQAKRRKHDCGKCYDYVPHEHPERLGGELDPTRYMQFIFTCASGDIAFCRTEYLQQIVKRMRQEPERTFLLQSKNPATFNRVKFPKNVILGTTIETNRDALAQAVSKAPPPSKRYFDLLTLKHRPKMVTVEPVLNFDLPILAHWIEDIHPAIVWIGYDSKKCNLQEPPLDKVKELYWELGRKGILVLLKTIREGRNVPPSDRVIDVNGEG